LVPGPPPQKTTPTPPHPRPHHATRRSNDAAYQPATLWYTAPQRGPPPGGLTHTCRTSKLRAEPPPKNPRYDRTNPSTPTRPGATWRPATTRKRRRQEKP